MKMMIRYGLPVSRIYSRYFGGDMKVRYFAMVIEIILLLFSFIGMMIGNG